MNEKCNHCGYRFNFEYEKICPICNTDNSAENKSVEEMIKGIREFNQLQIYTVNENWCIQLFDLDVCANDYDVQPCREFECIFETSGKDLYSVLSEALEWAKEQFED